VKHSTIMEISILGAPYTFGLDIHYSRHKAIPEGPYSPPEAEHVEIIAIMAYDPLRPDFKHSITGLIGNNREHWDDIHQKLLDEVRE
jgi:hypothetical protein